MLRFERKFKAQSIDCAAVSLRLKNAIPLLVTDYPDRAVHSLYFDDFLKSRVQEHLDGVGFRSKFRIRWYGSANSGLVFDRHIGDFDLAKAIQFEAKIRIGSMISKVTSEATGQTLDSAVERFTGQHLYEGLARAAGSIEPSPPHLAPVIFISYDRKYFRVLGSSIRFTVDSSIRFAPYHSEIDFGGSHLSNFPMHEDPVIVEMKCNSEDFERASQLMRALPWGETPYSKYIMAMKQ